MSRATTHTASTGEGGWERALVSGTTRVSQRSAPGGLSGSADGAKAKAGKFLGPLDPDAPRTPAQLLANRYPWSSA